LGTKNVPDAIEWHFAGYWDHLFTHYGMTKEELWQSLLPSQQRLARCVSLPVMVKHTPEQIDTNIEKLRSIATELL
jgi:hypothetical protein